MNGIQASELRLNNWATTIHNDKPTRVRKLSQQVVKDGTIYTISVFENSFHYRPEHIYAIPLTEEILLKAGFKKYSYVEGFKYFIQIAKFAFLSFWIDRGAGVISELIEVNEHDFETPCQYVHQLQNLYYCLTGTELIIEL